VLKGNPGVCRLILNTTTLVISADTKRNPSRLLWELTLRVRLAAEIQLCSCKLAAETQAQACKSTRTSAEL
jgi:hypothetical protein